jgi:hypothetical protein
MTGGGGGVLGSQLTPTVLAPTMPARWRLSITVARRSGLCAWQATSWPAYNTRT